MKCCSYKNQKGIIELKKKETNISQGLEDCGRNALQGKGEAYLDSLLKTCP